MHTSLPPIALLMMQLAVVIFLGRLLARGMRYLGQPAVIAEILAGILLGPSLLGWVAPGWMEALFPASSMASLSLISQLGLVFFMFLVGLEFDPKLLEGRGHQSLMISWVSIVVPFVLGGLLAWPLSAELAPQGVPFLSFALFLGAAMSITAFPVLARILAERGVMRTRIGAITLACAAVDDVTAWCILAFVVSVARAEGVAGALTTTGLALAYIGVVWFGVRPLLHRLGPRQGQLLSVETVAIAFFLLLLSATATELIGIHALFGGFLLGVAMPRGGLTHAITEKIEDFVTIVLLPLFFAYSGLRTRIGLLDDPHDWLLCLGIVLVACAGKFGGSLLAARGVGLSWREASAIGILMNTRGLMELIVLNVGLDLGVISPRLFAMMVIMALVTTYMTSPLLERIYPRKKMVQELQSENIPDEPVAPASTLLCVSDPALVPALVAIGHRLNPEGLIALHLVGSDRPSAYLAGEPVPEALSPLEVVKQEASRRVVKVRPLSFVAADPAQEILRVAEAKAATWVILGTHRPLLAEGDLGGVVRRVLREASMHVGVLVNRGLVEVEQMKVQGTGEGIAMLVQRLREAGVHEATELGPKVLLIAPIGTEVPEGVSALLVQERREI